ncbi:MAG: hypothetical protein JWO44_2537 [Bacteroidetes bacterium]|nr:hypothetical protein [Bacteroidota bacterium]
MQNASFFICLFLFSISSALSQENKTVPDSIRLEIVSSNLSEDMSTLSSNDDELLLLIYDYTDSTVTGSPAFTGYFTLHKKDQKVILPADPLGNFIQHDLLLFLIEIDSDKKPGDIEASVTHHYKELIAAYKLRDYLAIEKVIGDEDVLGIKVLPAFKPGKDNEIIFSDIYKMDRFSYSLIFR